MGRIFFAIRHKPTGGFLPEIYGVRSGYTHTKPNTYGVPRLFIDKSGAKRALTWWLNGIVTCSPHVDWESGQVDDIDWDCEVVEGRKAEEMEIVSIMLVPQ